MPYHHSGPTVSTQLLQAKHTESSHVGLGLLSPKPTLIPATLIQNDAPAPRKQHHVSFKEDTELGSSERDWGTAARNRVDVQDAVYPESEAGSAKATSSGHGRRDISDVDSSKSIGAESAPSSKNRHRKRTRNRSDKQAAQPPSSTASSAHKSSEAVLASSADRSSTSQPKSRDSSVSAKRSRQQSGPRILPDLRAPNTAKSEVSLRSTQTSSGGGGGRRDRFARSSDPRHAPGDVSASKEGRQLFDPRRDDPVKFASQQRGPIDDRARSGQGSSSPHLSARLSTAPSSVSQMLRDPSSSGNNVTKSPVLQPLSMEQSTSSAALELDDPKALQAHVVEVKKVYRSISLLETKLQDSHRKQADLEREAMGDLAPPDLHDRSYWIKLVTRHRDLAEAHATFLEMTCRPDLPRSVQELAEVYNIPSRLWQTGFHLMLESLRHNLSTHNSQKNGKARESELLDHLTEFIYYAYSFYSTLHESERYSGFRRAWIESLGDLSRYRMAVAGLAISLSLENGGEGIRNKQSSRPVARIDDDDNDDDDAGDAASNEDDLSDQVDKASIGSAALGDWEWIEKETWRQTAKDWYAKGIADSPIIGRLHHHIGVLSRDNELRALHHLTKSSIAVKPFANARESILTLFDQQRQSSRAWPDSTAEELFVHLHGILITRAQLDDFGPVLTRFIAKLESRGKGRGVDSLPQSVLMMMACINISALLQYGSDDAVLVDLLLQDSGKGVRRSKRTDKAKPATPTALLVNPTTNSDDNFLSELPRDAEWDDASDDESETGDPQVIQLDHKSDGVEALPELPPLARYAAEFCFSMFAACLRGSDDTHTVNPYVTTVSTFILSLCQSKRAFRLLERFVPWNLWLEHVERSVSLTERNWPKSLAVSFISPKLALPEDWCLRGIVGLSRQVYDRSVWRSKSSVNHYVSLHGFENEVELLECDDDELHRRVMLGGHEMAASLNTVRAYRLAYNARKLARAGRGFDLDTKTSKLSISKFLTARLTRWKLKEQHQRLEERIEALSLQSSSADTLLDIESDEDLLMTTESADSETASDELQMLLQRKCHLRDMLHNLAARVKCAPHERFSCHSDKRADVRKDVARSSQVSMGLETDQVVPGYTTLVVDTNVILTPGQMIQQLVESRRWTVIVPLAVITELDGLRRNDNVLGAEASNAINFLEERIKSQSKWLKVQTSRGNYLTDLSIRSEDIDFAWNDSFSSGNASASSLQSPLSSSISAGTTGEGSRPGVETKSVAARNVDEVILRTLAWQRDHFIDRRNMISSTEKATPNSTSKEGTMQVTSATHKSILLTLDRNLRLKAKTRGLSGLDEKGLARLMEVTTTIAAPRKE